MGDPLWTILAFTIIILIALAANIQKKIYRTDDRADSTDQIDYDIDSLSVLHAVRDGHIDSLIDQTKPTAKGDYRDGGEKELTRALVWWTFVLAAATAIAAIFAGFTLSAIRGQLDEMKIASDMAREANRISNAALVNVQRAFVIIHTPVLKTEWSVEEKQELFALLPIWENTGTTSTHNLVTKFACRNLPSEVRNYFIFEDKDIGAPWLLGPKQTDNLGVC
jgi:hypothetical protein